MCFSGNGLFCKLQTLYAYVNLRQQKHSREDDEDDFFEDADFGDDDDDLFD